MEDLTRVEGIFGADAIKRGCVCCVNYLLDKERLTTESVQEGFLERIEKLQDVKWKDIAGDDLSASRPRTYEIAAALLRRRGLTMSVDVRQVITGETDEEMKKREREEMLLAWEKRRKTK